MFRATRVLFGLVVGITTVAQTTVAQSASLTSTTVTPRFSEQQLDKLVAPVALYPDALLAQVLIASTFPDQVVAAAQWVRTHGNAKVDSMSWDVSIKSVAHYPSVLNALADKSEWTASLGQAYAFQSSDVMTAVQRLRAMADAQGNLVSTEQQQVVQENDAYVIAPAQANVIYVPVYDPIVVFTQPVFGQRYSSSYWSFGVGCPIGGWLNYDLDWGRRVVYYNGWQHQYLGYASGWRARSLPYVHITRVYVNPVYRIVNVGRGPWNRSVASHDDRDDRGGRNRGGVGDDRNGRGYGDDRNGRGYGDDRNGRGYGDDRGYGRDANDDRGGYGNRGNGGTTSSRDHSRDADRDRWVQGYDRTRDARPRNGVGTGQRVGSGNAVTGYGFGHGAGGAGGISSGFGAGAGTIGDRRGAVDRSSSNGWNRSGTGGSTIIRPVVPSRPAEPPQGHGSDPRGRTGQHR